MIRALFDAGADVFRLNFSHGEHDTHEAALNAIRAVRAKQVGPSGSSPTCKAPS